MAEYRFTAKIEHTEITLEELFKTQYYTYNKIRMILRMVFGAIAAVGAVIFEMPMWLKGVLLIMGCWLLVSKDFPAQMRADRALQARHGSLPKMKYGFGEKVFNVSGEGSKDIKYSEIARLAEDAAYLYIFMGKDSVCMMERESIKPESCEDFMKFIAEKTGLTWKREKSIVLMNIFDIKDMIRERNKK